MQVRKGIAVVGILAMLGSASIASAQNAAPAVASADDLYSAGHWSGLPFMREEAVKRGYTLPLPLGLSFNYVTVKEHHTIDEARLNVGFPIPPIPNLAEAEANVDSYTVRVDAWILPFLNVYAIGGYNKGDAKADLSPAMQAMAGAMGISIPNAIGFEGPIYGAGMIVAGGYKELFATVEANYTITDLNLLKSDVRTWVVDPRIGWRHSFGRNMIGSFWVGAMYQECQETVSGDISLGGVPASFSVDQSSKDPWNYLVGTRWEIDKNWSAMVELGGLTDRKQLAVAVGTRF